MSSKFLFIPMEFARPIDSSTNLIQPSFFDLLSQSNFESLIYSLFEPPIALLQASDNRRALFYGVKAMIDLGMVAGFGGITSEVIYGLERAHRLGAHNKIGKTIIYLVTLLECHLVPFLKLKLPQPLKKIVKFLDLLIKLAYITSDSKSFSLLHFLTGISYQHSGTDVYEQQETFGKIIKTLLIGGQLAVYLIQSGVLEKLKSPSQTSPNSIEPPEISKLIPQPHPKGFPTPKRAGICPCCLESWKDPVVISSGYIYCSKCIKSYKSCPVTKTPIFHFIPLFLQ